MCDLSTPPRGAGVERSVFRRTCSLPAAVEPGAPSSSPSRATFPFKPNSTLIELQKSNSVDSQFIPSAFHPQPVASGLTGLLYHPPPIPKRCASFPIDPSNSNIHLTQPQIIQPLEPPEWLVSSNDLLRYNAPLFPISIDNKRADRKCWWLKEMHKIVHHSPTAIVEGEDEIELVESNVGSSSSSEEGDDQYEIDIIEEAASLEIGEEGTEGKSSSSSIHVEVGTMEVRESSETAEATEENDAGPTDTNRAQKEIPQHNVEPTTLEEKMKILRSEMDKADLDPEKRMKMEKLFLQVEGAMQLDNPATTAEKSEDQTNDESASQPNAFDHIRRTAVAVTGGTLTAAGIVLIPCPIIPGCLVVYGGLAVLATEFDAAKKALDTVKEPLGKWLADDDEDAKANEAIGEHNSTAWENLIGYSPPENCKQRKQDIDDEFMTLVNMTGKSSSGGDNDASSGQKSAPDTAAAAAIKPLKPFLRKLLNLESSGVESNQCNSKDNSISDNKKGPDKEEAEQAAAPQADCTSPASLGGCQPFSFDHGDDDDNDQFPQIFCGSENITKGQQTKLLQRLQSDGSITLNTLANDGDEGSVRLFSRQNTAASIDQTSDDCLWILNGCNALLDDQFRPLSITD